MIDLLQRMRHFNPSQGQKTTFMARSSNVTSPPFWRPGSPMPGLAALQTISQRTLDNG